VIRTLVEVAPLSLNAAERLLALQDSANAILHCIVLGYNETCATQKAALKHTKTPHPEGESECGDWLHTTLEERETYAGRCFECSLILGLACVCGRRVGSKQVYEAIASFPTFASRLLTRLRGIFKDIHPTVLQGVRLIAYETTPETEEGEGEGEGEKERQVVLNDGRALRRAAVAKHIALSAHGEDNME
ncbi:hypothetical protein KIPB_014365, partial [Kipferlia bialata]